jgi:hypothetical protein
LQAPARGDSFAIIAIAAKSLAAASILRLVELRRRQEVRDLRGRSERHRSVPPSVSVA